MQRIVLLVFPLALAACAQQVASNTTGPLTTTLYQTGSGPSYALTVSQAGQARPIYDWDNIAMVRDGRPVTLTGITGTFRSPHDVTVVMPAHTADCPLFYTIAKVNQHPLFGANITPCGPHFDFALQGTMIRGTETGATDPLVLYLLDGRDISGPFRVSQWDQLKAQHDAAIRQQQQAQQQAEADARAAEERASEERAAADRAAADRALAIRAALERPHADPPTARPAASSVAPRPEPVRPTPLQPTGEPPVTTLPTATPPSTGAE